jgi:hypothetical protein
MMTAMTGNAEHLAIEKSLYRLRLIPSAGLPRQCLDIFELPEPDAQGPFGR